MAADQKDDREQYAEDPRGWASRWQKEFVAARKEVEPWHTQAEAILKRFRDERKDEKHSPLTRWNLFWANIHTQRCLLYGKTPKVTVSRKFADANDDVARVAALIMERHLNCDIARDNDTFSFALECVLDDRLLTGLGNAKVRYVMGETEKEPGQPEVRDEATGQVLAEAVQEVERRPNEDVEIDWVHWKDQLWSAGARTESEKRWHAFRGQMTRRELVKRFGEELAKLVPLNSKSNIKGDGGEPMPWDRADVWEIWSKEDGAVYWYVDGFDQTLDMKKDPMGLSGFWPFPRPLTANLTTSTLVPRPDFVMAQDLYNEVDTVSSRISTLVEALRVVGIYDKTATSELERIVKGKENEMIPVPNWGAISERGGLKGIVDWLPLEAVVNTLIGLRDYRTECVSALFQITGWSDIMRGESGEAGVTAHEQVIKSRFASVRVQRMQDEFARFASDLQRLKGEVVAKFFEPQTILERSNIQYTEDKELAPQAVELLQSNYAQWRIEVKPEAVAMDDFATLKAERTEFLLAFSSFLTSAAPLAAQMPGAMPHMLEILKWSMAGLRGSSSIEATLDRAIATAQEAAKQPQPPAPPDPKVQAQMLKGQADQQKAALDMEKERFKAQADLLHLQAEVEAKKQTELNQAVANISEARAKHALVKSNASPAFTPGEPS